jgi:TRAP-type mannitol/chloroaromatic compound transport system substrate-binding protein
MTDEKKIEEQSTQRVSRRNVLKAAVAAGGAAALGFPNIVKAQGVTTMRWQSTWPSKDIFHEYALDYAKKVNDMTGGDLKIEVLPAGAVVPAFGLLDAVSKGTLDGGHGVLAYHYGKQNALALWGSGPGYAMDANMLLAWHKYGGGKELLDKLYASIGANVVSFPYGPMPTQPLGWYKKPMTKAEDFQGLKFRTVGISIDVFTGLGAAVNALPGGEIVSAMDRGLLDAAEFNNATSDRILGFADVSKICMLQSYHQNAEQLEILFNKTKFDALPEKMKAILSNAVEAASQEMAWKAIDRYSKDFRIRYSRSSWRFSIRSPKRNRRKIRCSSKSSNRKWPLPGGRRSGSRIRWSTGAWPIITISARTPRRRADQVIRRAEASGSGDPRMMHVLSHYRIGATKIAGNNAHERAASSVHH